MMIVLCGNVAWQLLNDEMAGQETGHSSLLGWRAARSTQPVISNKQALVVAQQHRDV